MQYDWILFDADETLFHFDSFSGIKLMLERRDIELTDQTYQNYEKINKPLWVDYQNGNISAKELKHTRFKPWAEQLNTTPETLNSEYMQAMADICRLLPGAKELIHSLVGRVKLGIITNGFSDLQTIRLERTGMAAHFEHVVISEEVGMAKPDCRIFEYALTLMGNPDKKRVLMVGDNPHSDILGGINAGIETCWLNCNKGEAPENINADVEVGSLKELQRFLLA